MSGVTLPNISPINVTVTGGIGPAIIVDGSATSLIGVAGLNPLVGGSNVTVSASSGNVVISAANPPVVSVQGRTGSVVLTLADLTGAAAVHTHSTSDVSGFTAAVQSLTPVFSVQGRTGTVTLTLADVTGAPAVHTHSTNEVSGFTAAVQSLTPVFSVQGRTGTVTLTLADLTGAPAVHTHSTSDVSGLSEAIQILSPIASVQGRTGAVTLTLLDITAANAVHAHSTNDVSGFTAAVQSLIPVASVQGRTGAVTLSLADVTGAAAVHTHSTSDVSGLASAVQSLSPVSSVQGRTGAVTLSLADVTGAAAVHTHSVSDISGAVADSDPRLSVTWPVRAVHVGGLFRITNGSGQFQNFWPTWPNGTYGDLATLATVEHATQSVTVDLTANVNAILAANPGWSFSRSSLEIVLLDCDNRVVGWGTTSSDGTAGPTNGNGGHIITVAVGAFPAISSEFLNNWVLSNQQGTFSSQESYVLARPTPYKLVSHRLLDTGKYDAVNVVGLTAAAAAAAPVQSVSGLTGSVSLLAGANITISTTSSGITFAGGDSLPSQGGNAEKLLATDGTTAYWETRFSIVDDTILAGDGIIFASDTNAGTITIEAAGGTSGVTVGSATPQPLGVAAAGSSGNAARQDHVHAMPSASDVGAAAAVHTHSTTEISGLTATIQTLSPVASVQGRTGNVVLSLADITAAPSVHTHSTSDVSGFTAAASLYGPVLSVAGVTGAVSVLAGANVTVSTSGSSLTISAAAGGGGGSSEGSRSILFLLR